MAEGGWLTTPEVAERLRTSTRTIYDWRVAGGGPPAHRVGRRLLCLPAAEQHVGHVMRQRVATGPLGARIEERPQAPSARDGTGGDPAEVARRGRIAALRRRARELLGRSFPGAHELTSTEPATGERVDLALVGAPALTLPRSVL